MDGPALIHDRPTTREQLDSNVATVLDPHMIGPEPTVARRVGLLGQIADCDADGDCAGHRDIREKHGQCADVPAPSLGETTGAAQPFDEPMPRFSDRTRTVSYDVAQQEVAGELESLRDLGPG